MSKITIVFILITIMLSISGCSDTSIQFKIKEISQSMDELKENTNKFQLEYTSIKDIRENTDKYIGQDVILRNVNYKHGSSSYSYWILPSDNSRSIGISNHLNDNGYVIYMFPELIINDKLNTYGTYTNPHSDSFNIWTDDTVIVTVRGKINYVNAKRTINNEIIELLVIEPYELQYQGLVWTV